MRRSGETTSGAGAAARPRGRPAQRVDVDALRARLEEAEATLRAIRSGEIDAIMVDGPNGPRVYTLLTADQTYRTLVEQMREAALTLSEDGLILYCNSHLSGPLGLGREDVAGRHLAELAGPDHRAELEEMLERGREEATGGEVWLQRADGEDIPFQLSLSPLRTESFTGICAVASDLTEQKARERTVADERLTQAIVEFAGTAILVCDGDGRILRANPQASGLLGDVTGRACEEVLSLDCPLEALAGEDTARPMELHQDEAEPVYLLAEVRALDDLFALQRARWVVTLTDVTVLRRAERAAERASRAKSQFLAVMSHELRTPLTSIVGYADMVADVCGPVNEAQQKQLQRIKESAYHLREIIEDILALARSDNGVSIHLETVDASAVLRHSATLLGGGAGDSVRMRVEAPEREVLLVTDAAKLRQILLNLTGNALKFSEEGQVVLSLEESEHEVAFRVRDCGSGIEPEHLERIFQPFWQADRSSMRARGGAGLGLAIVKRYVDLLGGEIQVESEPGAGSIFTVRLPRGGPEAG